MTTEPTVHDRIVQAILRDAQLLDEMTALKEKLLAAKQAEDAVRKDPKFGEKVATLKAEYVEAVAEGKAICDIAIAKAEIPFIAAGKVFTAAKADAEGEFSKVQEKADAEYQAKLAAENRARELELADAKSIVHRAQQDLTEQATTRDQHRRNIQDRLGINLGNLLG